jgi:hypothetical protein
MAKLQSPEEISRRFDPVTEAELSAAAEEADSVENAAALPDSPLPAGIARRIAQRVQARSRFADDHTPEPGKIVAIHPEAKMDLGNLAAEPIPILLDVLEASGKTWRGWIVARDRGYATCWDLILGPEEEDRDPLCEIVQGWNPVRVSLPKDVRILGQLLPYRLAALRTLAVDYENGFISGPRDEHRLGVALARELSDGTGIVTGTSIASDDDPRVEYQRLYREIAQKLPAPVQSARAPRPQAARPAFFQRLLGLPPWQLGGAVATLLLAPLVVMLVSQDRPEDLSIAVAPSELTRGIQQHRYTGTGELQQLRVADPEAKAREIVEVLRAIGALPETRSSWAGMVSIRADLSKIPLAEQSKALSRFALAVPKDGILRVDVLQGETHPNSTDSGTGRPPR